MAAGLGLNLLADQSLHAAGTTVKPDEPPSVVVTAGVYRLSRHPMYLGFVAVPVGVALLLASLTPWLVVPVLMAVLDRAFILGEERMMAATFGAAWEGYTRKVCRCV
jgi:protein-S-isoprenylcysteine O-methyltransferase Ste14